MPLIILFEDNEAHADQRQIHMKAHLAFLEANSATIQAAGPLLEGGAGAGGLWLLSIDDAAVAQELVEADPFWPTGLRSRVRILTWRQVFAEGHRLS
ncbi:MAG: YciI family protein [Pseudomonadota bacterium]